MKVYEATVTLADGTKIEVEYPASAEQPNVAALKAAEKKLGRAIEAEPRIRHRRDGDGKEVPDGDR